MAEPVPRRFVLLQHEIHGARHFDFMIEDGGTLATWQLDRSPTLLKPGEEWPCLRLAQHRAAYLTYEGPVSGDRGAVTRIAAGICDALAATATRWTFALHSPALAGRFELRHLTGSAWKLKMFAAA